jgi:DNA-binding NtrC family response regulator
MQDTMFAVGRVAPPVPLSVVKPVKAMVVIVSDDAVLANSLELVCDFLDLGVERVSSEQDLMGVLRSHGPMAVITEMDGRGQDGFHVMMTVSRHDRSLPLMLLTNDDPILAGAAEAVQELWGLTGVVKVDRPPAIGRLVDFLFRAGRRAGSMRLLPV